MTFKKIDTLPTWFYTFVPCTNPASVLPDATKIIKVTETVDADHIKKLIATAPTLERRITKINGQNTFTDDFSLELDIIRLKNKVMETSNLGSGNKMIYTNVEIPDAVKAKMPNVEFIRDDVFGVDDHLVSYFETTGDTMHALIVQVGESFAINPEKENPFVKLKVK